jgi:Cu/Ag efflux protein CusF
MSFLSRLYSGTALIFLLAVVSISVASGNSVGAQTPTGQVTDSASVTAKATIEAIDHTNRLITLKLENGKSAVFQVDPSVKRFHDLKVGDVVTATYTESLAVRVRKPGELEPAKEKETVTPREGKPGVKAEYEQTATVTVEEIDPTVPSVKVKDEKGEILSFRVRDPSRLQGVKVGDKVDITYTQAVLLNADAPTPE